MRVIPLNDSGFDAVERMVSARTSSDILSPSTICGARAVVREPAPQTRPNEAGEQVGYRGARTARRDRPAGLRFHDLRHTVVTRLLEAGEPDHVVESITGHLSRRILEHYSHIRLKAKKVALDRLDESGRTGSLKTAK